MLAEIKLARSFKAAIPFPIATEFVPTYAFGDGPNDLEMFQEVDYAIAMGNSCEPLKECAHYVTDAIHEDGIYNALRYLKLI